MCEPSFEKNLNHRNQRMRCDKFGYPCNLAKWYRRRILNLIRLGQRRGKHQQETKKGQKSLINRAFNSGEI